MSTDGGAVWNEQDKTLDDGFALALGSALYQAGSWKPDPKNTLIRMAVFKSSDKGETWQHKTLSDSAGVVKALVVHPTNKNILFAGGTVWWNRFMKNAVTKSVLYATQDAGETWIEIEGLNGKSDCINGLVFEPGNPNRLLAAMNNGVAISEDGGKIWKLPSQQVAALCIVADQLQKGRFFIGGPKGAWRSDDGGITWKELNEGLTIRSILCLTYDSKNSILYAGTESGGTVRLHLK
ncbi:MAG: hypothetical protein V1799_16455 [bacterium]